MTTAVPRRGLRRIILVSVMGDVWLHLLQWGVNANRGSCFIYADPGRSQLSASVPSHILPAASPDGSWKATNRLCRIYNLWLVFAAAGANARLTVLITSRSSPCPAALRYAVRPLDHDQLAHPPTDESSDSKTDAWCYSSCYLLLEGQLLLGSSRSRQSRLDFRII